MATIPPTPPGSQFSAYAWQDWYEKVRRLINEAGNISWSQITNFTGSNLTALATRNHNDLQNIQGGAATDYNHLTSAQYTYVTNNIAANAAGRLAHSTTTLGNGAAAAAGTLGNAPAAGNPTKWIPINDNGVIRHIPAW